MKIFLFFILFFILFQAKSQVGIDNPIPDTTSVLDMKSTTKGFLMPRMTSSQRNNINTNANSLMLFDTDINKYMYWNTSNSQWAMLNPWYAEEDGIIHYGAKNLDFKVNIEPIGGYNIFRVSTKYNGQSGNANDFQTEFTFNDNLISNSGVKFNSKVTSLNFILLQAYYNGNKVMTVKSNGNVGIGESNPTKKLEVDGEIKVSGNVTAAKFVGQGIAPVGSVVMWSGSIASIPSGWALCDGNNGTPDLKNQFLIGAGNAYSAGSTGGSNRVTLTKNQMPSHSHSGTTNSAGGHTHHVVRDQIDNNGNTSIAWKSDDGNYEEYNIYGHSNTANWGETDSDGSHTHSLNIDNTGGGGSHENRPPYYALAFIIRTN